MGGALIGSVEDKSGVSKISPQLSTQAGALCRGIEVGRRGQRGGAVESMGIQGLATPSRCELN